MGALTGILHHMDWISLLLFAMSGAACLICLTVHELAHGICEETSFNSMLMDKLGENGYEIFIDSLGKTIYNMIHMNDMNLIEDYIKKSK